MKEILKDHEDSSLHEVEELGIIAVQKFKIMCGINLADFTLADLHWLYKSIITEPHKYVDFVKWLKPRFDEYIYLGLTMRIYVGNKQFLMRGDDILEASLLKVSSDLEEYITKHIATPKRISSLFYYLNLMIK